MAEIGFGFPSESGLPVGVVLPFFGDETDVPRGWLLCDGRKFSIGQYAKLAAQLSRAAGVYTDTTPDLRGRVPVGRDNMGGTSANNVTGAWADSVGGTGGQEAATMPSHDHQQQFNDVASGGGDGTMRPLSRYASGSPGGQNGYFATAAGSEVIASSFTNKTTVTSVNTASAGGTGDNMPPSIAMNYIIKAA